MDKTAIMILRKGGKILDIDHTDILKECISSSFRVKEKVK
jgi:hypothetical protein